MVGKRLIRTEIAGVLFVGLLGVLLHFAYDWSGGNGLVGAFSAVNESIWEHLKLLFFPAMLFSVLQYWRTGYLLPNFWAVRTVSVLAGTVLIPVLFYTYSGILGRNVDWVNIAIFFVAVIGVFGLDGLLRRTGAFGGGWKQVLGVAILWVLAFLFIWSTWHPVELPLWQDPITGTYGIQT